MYNLQLPLKYIYVTQPFGVNYVDFYEKLGLDGHSGIDSRTKNGCLCYAANDGVVTWAGKDGTGGIGITIFNEIEKFKTIYYHLKKCLVKKGDIVKAGDRIAECDNTGKYTTADHLHFGMKLTYEDGSTYNYNNGFKGAVNPALYFNTRYNGKPMATKDWNKSRCYHRYDRGRPKGGYINELKVVASLIPYLKRLPSNEEINCCVYGGWEREVLKNPAMYALYSNLKKSEYQAKIIPYLDRGVEI